MWSAPPWARPHPLPWSREQPAGAWWSGAQASERPANGVGRQPHGTPCLEGHHASGPQRVHLLGRGCQAEDDPRTPHSSDPGGTGGRPAPSLLLARVFAPRAHRQVAVGCVPLAGLRAQCRGGDRPARGPLGPPARGRTAFRHRREGALCDGGVRPRRHRSSTNRSTGLDRRTGTSDRARKGRSSAPLRRHSHDRRGRPPRPATGRHRSLRQPQLRSNYVACGSV